MIGFSSFSLFGGNDSRFESRQAPAPKTKQPTQGMFTGAPQSVTQQQRSAVPLRQGGGQSADSLDKFMSKSSLKSHVPPQLALPNSIPGLESHYSCGSRDAPMRRPSPAEVDYSTDSRGSCEDRHVPGHGDYAPQYRPEPSQGHHAMNLARQQDEENRRYSREEQFAVGGFNRPQQDYVPGRGPPPKLSAQDYATELRMQIEEKKRIGGSLEKERHSRNSHLNVIQQNVFTRAVQSNRTSLDMGSQAEERYQQYPAQDEQSNRRFSNSHNTGRSQFSLAWN